MKGLKITHNGVEIEISSEDAENIYRAVDFDYKKQDVLNRIEDVDEDGVKYIVEQFERNLSKNDYYWESYWMSMDLAIDNYKDNNK